MNVIGNLKSILDIVDKLSQKNKQAKDEQNFNAVMMAMYKLSEEGRMGVILQDLVDFGFTKMQIFEATQRADARGWFIDVSTHDHPYAWIPKQQACQYVEALLEAE